MVVTYKIKKAYLRYASFILAAGTGFEPVQSESESLVLPLHHPAIFIWCEGRDLNSQGINHTPLKRARLPIPPPSPIHNSIIITGFFQFVNYFFRKIVNFLLIYLPIIPHHKILNQTLCPKLPLSK